MNASAQIERSADRDEADLKAFSAAKLAYLSGAYTEQNDLLKLVQYYRFYGAPYEAAKLLETELEKGRIGKTSSMYIQLANLYTYAREDELAQRAWLKATELNGGKELSRRILNRPLDMTSIQKMHFNLQCAEIEKLMKTSELSLGAKSKAYMSLGMCWYEQAQAQDSLMTCVDPHWPGWNKTDWMQSIQKSKDAFEWVPHQTREKITAKKWIKFIDEEIDNKKTVCDYKINYEEELCYQKIKLAYNADVGDSIRESLFPHECQPYKKSYDKNFRVATPRN